MIKEQAMNSVSPSLSVEQTRQRIDELLNSLPPENLLIVQRFIEFVREQARQGQPIGVTKAREAEPAYLHPTVENPASSLGNWLDVIPGGCGGDALADTEALYDEV
jgi:hypothetical protein